MPTTTCTMASKGEQCGSRSLLHSDGNDAAFVELSHLLNKRKASRRHHPRSYSPRSVSGIRERQPNYSSSTSTALLLNPPASLVIPSFDTSHGYVHGYEARYHHCRRGIEMPSAEQTPADQTWRGTKTSIQRRETDAVAASCIIDAETPGHSAPSLDSTCFGPFVHSEESSDDNDSEEEELWSSPKKRRYHFDPDELMALPDHHMHVFPRLQNMSPDSMCYTSPVAKREE